MFEYEEGYGDEGEALDIAVNVYGDYLKIADELNVEANARYDLEFFEDNIRTFEDQFKNIYARISKNNFDWMPFEFHICLHEYGKSNALDFVDLTVEVSDIEFDDYDFISSATTSYTLTFSDSRLKDLFNSEEYRINSIINGDYIEDYEDFNDDDEEDNDKPWL